MIIFKTQYNNDANIKINHLTQYDLLRLSKIKNKKRLENFIKIRLQIYDWAKRRGIRKKNIQLYEYQKPVIYGRKKIFISITYSGNLCFALVGKKDIGVDFEIERTIQKNCNRLILHPNEKDACNIIKLWTIKEAIVKLLGVGLKTDMREIDTSHYNKHEYVKFDNKKFFLKSYQISGGFLSIASYKKIKKNEITWSITS